MKLAARTWAWFAGTAPRGACRPAWICKDSDARRFGRRRPMKCRRSPIASALSAAQPLGGDGGARLLDERQSEQPQQQRPLLVLPARPEPARAASCAACCAPPGRGEPVCRGHRATPSTSTPSTATASEMADPGPALCRWCCSATAIPWIPPAFRPDQPGATDDRSRSRRADVHRDRRTCCLYQDIVGTVVKAAYPERRTSSAVPMQLRNGLREAPFEGRAAAASTTRATGSAAAANTSSGSSRSCAGRPHPAASRAPGLEPVRQRDGGVRQRWCPVEWPCPSWS